jgi:hypothetical protein
LRTGDRVDIFVTLSKVLAGEEVASTLHFLKALSVAASTESMIHASDAAAEKILQT